MHDTFDALIANLIMGSHLLVRQDFNILHIVILIVLPPIHHASIDNH